MNSLAAFAMGEANRHRPQKIFDWDKAARLIRDNKPSVASAGLSGDWEYTGDTIFEDGEPVTDSYTYLSSCWATPELDMDGEIVDCWSYADERGFNEKTKWPASALEILKSPPCAP